MKFARVRHELAPRWGVVDVDARRIDLIVGSPYDGFQKTDVQVALSDDALLPPVEPSKIYCLGRNYAGHVAEMGYEQLGPPSLFMKGPTTIIGPGTDVVLPPISVDDVIEHEAELAIVIGRAARNVPRTKARDVILGYTCADDVSARTLQRGDPYPTRGKGFDTFCPVGPWIDTDLDPYSGARITSRVNGELRQNGSTDQMVYDVGAIVEFISSFATLLPGDLILTGAPAGVGSLRAGDAVEIEIEGIGILRHGVVADVRS